MSFTMFERGMRQEIADAVARINSPTQLTTAPQNNSVKHAVVGWMQNIIIRNVSDVSTVAYLDLYYWRTKRDVPYDEFASADLLWSNGFTYNATNVDGSANDTALTASDLGVTPWANPAFRKFCEIYMKRRIRLGTGQDTEISLRSPKTFYNNGEYFQDQKSLVRGITQGVLVVFHGGPSFTTTAEAVELSASMTRTVYYKVLQGAVRSAGDTALA